MGKIIEYFCDCCKTTSLREQDFGKFFIRFSNDRTPNPQKVFCKDSTIEHICEACAEELNSGIEKAVDTFLMGKLK